MKPGDTVTLLAAGDRQITRRVVAVHGRVVFVCREDERASAEREEREPIAMGFPVSDVISAHPTGE